MDSQAIILDAEMAHRRLREDILHGRRSPGEKLATARLAADFGISRTPVKEALARLESDQLVVRADNWGYSVRTISFRDAEEMFESRLVIEVANVKFAAERILDEEIAAMEQLLLSACQKLKVDDFIGFQHDSRRIHERISLATGNSTLHRMFGQINDLVLLFGISLLRANTRRATDMLAENEAIVKALRDRKKEAAGDLMRSHIEQGHASFRATMMSMRTVMPVI